jgi:uncharacterized protein involved in type VI secretion and phage assembly
LKRRHNCCRLLGQLTCRRLNSFHACGLVRSSCWIRVAQSFAGKRWGAYFWPRLGQEVLAAFVEGDPDPPIIVASLYNAEQMPPYEGDGLDSKHKKDPNVSGIKANSSLGGTGFNEIRFVIRRTKSRYSSMPSETLKLPRRTIHSLELMVIVTRSSGRKKMAARQATSSKRSTTTSR